MLLEIDRIDTVCLQNQSEFVQYFPPTGKSPVVAHWMFQP